MARQKPAEPTYYTYLRDQQNRMLQVKVACCAGQIVNMVEIDPASPSYRGPTVVGDRPVTRVVVVYLAKKLELKDPSPERRLRKRRAARAAAQPPAPAPVLLIGGDSPADATHRVEPGGNIVPVEVPAQ